MYFTRGVPFPVEYNKETMAAMVEAKSISHDPNVPSYSNMEDLLKVLGGVADIFCRR